MDNLVLVNLHIPSTAPDVVGLRVVVLTCVVTHSPLAQLRDLQREDVVNIIITVTIAKTSHYLSTSSLKLRSSMFNRKTPFQHSPLISIERFLDAAALMKALHIHR
jgi:hypothetical protein